MKRAKHYRVIALSGYCIIGLLGCAAVKEGVKSAAGISTRPLEEARKTAIVKSFSCDYFTCYTKTWDILKHTGAYVYAQDIKRHMIAIYVSGEDTTPVGLFFKEAGAANTQIEVSSPSTYAKGLIADKVFPVLEKSLNLEKE